VRLGVHFFFMGLGVHIYDTTDTRRTQQRRDTRVLMTHEKN